MRQLAVYNGAIPGRACRAGEHASDCRCLSQADTGHGERPPPGIRPEVVVADLGEVLVPPIGEAGAPGVEAPADRSAPLPHAAANDPSAATPSAPP